MATAIRNARPVTLLFAAAAAVSAALLLSLGSHLTFLLDDWEVLVYRRGFDAHAILSPHGENIAVGLVLVYKGLLELFGMDSALPFRVVSVAVFLLSVSLLFVLLRRRVGEWLALAGAISVLFLGPAWEDLLWSFQIGYFASMAAGLGAVLMLERRDSRADLIACALLSVSVLFSSLGLPFLVYAAVMIGLGPRTAVTSRLFTLVVPAGIFAVWWIGWGHEADTSITLDNIATAPLFLFEGLASSLSSLLGLATPRDEASVNAVAWGTPLLVTAAGLVGWRLWKVRRVDPELVAFGAFTAAFWLLAGINEKPGREPLASRYQYIGVIFLLLIVAQLCSGIRLRRPALIGVFVVTALALASNISYLDQAYRSYLGTSQIERADLAALEIARGTVEPGFLLSEQVAHTAYVGVEAGPYFSAVDAFGSPAYDEEELVAATPAARAAADSVLAAALHLTSTKTTAPPTSGCESADVARDEPQAVDLPVGGATVVNGGTQPLDLAVKRFGDGFDTEAGTVAPGAAQVITIPPDQSTQPWQLELVGAGSAAICPASDS